MTIKVIDAETRQPLPGTKVDIAYPNMLDFTAPKPVSGETNSEGVVTLVVGEYDNTLLSAEHQDYSQVDRDRLEPGFVTALPKKPSGLGVYYVVELWAKPAPTVEFVIPPDYRGPIKARFEQADPENFSARQRLFRAISTPAAM